jgi:hypothetical protein
MPLYIDTSTNRRQGRNRGRDRLSEKAFREFNRKVKKLTGSTWFVSPDFGDIVQRDRQSNY